MRTVLKTFGILILILSVMCACSSKDEGKSSKKGKQAATPVAKTDDQTNKTDTEDTDSDKEQTADDVEANNKFNMKIGESATYHDVIGNFKITLKSVEHVEAIDDETVKRLSGINGKKDYYIKALVSIKNVGKQIFTVNDIFDPVLTAGNIDDIDKSVPDMSFEIKGVKPLYKRGLDLKPGESYEGYIVFDSVKNDYYTLHFLDDYEKVVGHASWKFTADEMK